MKFVYIFPIISTVSRRNPKSSMIASSLVWSIKPKTLRKSMCVRYISA